MHAPTNRAYKQVLIGIVKKYLQILKSILFIGFFYQYEMYTQLQTEEMTINFLSVFLQISQAAITK